MNYEEAKEIVEKLATDEESWKNTKIDIMFGAFGTCLYNLIKENEYEDNDK